MSACCSHVSCGHVRRNLSLAALTAAAVLLAGCSPDAETAAPEVRPVRTVTVVKREIGETVTYTGRIEAENETRLSFRISGRMIERSANVGDRVEPGQVAAKLEPQDELNALRSAQAAVAAAEAQFAEAKSNFERQRTLLARDVASRAQFERAEQTMETARAQLDTAQAQLKAAKDRVSDTELKVDSAGTVIATGAEGGEVVQAGQMIIRVARKDGRDAVFDVPGQLLRSAPSDPLINVSLTDDAAVTTIGRVREVSPQADPVTRTFQVKVGLRDSAGGHAAGLDRGGTHAARRGSGHGASGFCSYQGRWAARRLGRRSGQIDRVAAKRECAAPQSGNGRHIRGPRFG